MRRTEALASVKFYQILSIFIFFIRLIILEDFMRLISYNGPCVRLGCSFFLATALEPMVALQNVGCFLSLSKVWLLVRSLWWLFLLNCFRVWHWTVLKSHCQEYLSMDKHMSPFHEQEACKDLEFWTLTASVYEFILMSYVIMQGYREKQNWCNAIIIRMKIKRTSALRRKNPAKDPK